MEEQLDSSGNLLANLSGYYGKLPLRGDFIQRNLDPEFIQHWDQWLQNVIGTSRDTLGEQWLNYYLVSPIWHFYLHNEAGEIYYGVMLPSVDKVGRYFPFSIMNSATPEMNAAEFILSQQHWFELAENLALQALEEKISFEQLNLCIDELHKKTTTNNPEPTVPIKSFRIPLNGQVDLNNAFGQLRQVLPSSTTQVYSYWWTTGNEHIEGNLICCDKMPDDNMYTAMLDGQWDLCHIQTFPQSPTNTHNETNSLSNSLPTNTLPDNLDKFL